MFDFGFSPLKYDRLTFGATASLRVFRPSRTIAFNALIGQVSYLELLTYSFLLNI